MVVTTVSEEVDEPRHTFEQMRRMVESGISIETTNY
jgi:hypothetical protein